MKRKIHCRKKIGSDFVNFIVSSEHDDDTSNVMVRAQSDQPNVGSRMLAIPL